MLKKIFIFIFVFGIISGISTATAGNNSEISNDYFSFTMPKDTKNTYSVNKEDNGIYISEKKSAKAGLGGFAFGLALYDDPKDYADMEDSRKIGELTDKNGTLYDMVLIKPREIYYADGKKTAKNFTRLYDFAENVEIKGINGNKYVKNQGMKGEDLYRETLKKYKNSIKQKTLLNKTGFTYYDLNNDGIDELLTGEITKDNSIGTIYDIYTMADRKPVHVISGGEKNRLFVSNENFLWTEILSSGKNTVNIVTLERNSKTLNPFAGFVYDTKQNKYFVSYGINGYLENVSEETFNERKEYFSDFKKFDYIPLSILK